MRPPSFRTLCLLGFLLWGDAAYSQRYLTTFGAVTELRAPHGATMLIQGDFNGDGTADLAAASASRLIVHYQSTTGDAWRSTTIPFSARIRALAAGRCNGDRADDLVVLTEEPLTLSVLLATRRGGFSRKWQTPVGGQFDAVSVGDLNSDGRADLVLYGKKELGVLVFLGNGDGTYQEPVNLLQEFSVSALAIADVNKDGLNDLFVTNWLSNKVLVYENFGKLTFSEPTALSLPFEPGQLCVAKIDSDINADLVIAGKDRPVCRVYLGNGLGSYRPDGEFSFSSPAEKITCADVNGDRVNDIVAFCPDGKALEVALNGGSGDFREQLTIDGGQRPAAAVLFPQAPRGAIAAAVLDAAVDRLRLLASARRGRPDGRHGEFLLATGKHPLAVQAVELNRDGWKDLLVADAASRDIAAFFNDSAASFTGFVPFQTTVNMSQLVHLSRRDGSHLLIGGALDSDAIAIVEINAKTYGHTTTLIPAAGRVEVLAAASAGGRLRIVGMERSKEGRPSLLAFDELEGGRFTEQDLRPGSDLAAAAAGAPDADRKFTIATLTRGAKNDTLELTVSRNGSGGPPVASFVTSAPAELWMADLNRDGQPDIVLHFGPPENALKFVFRSADGWNAPVTYQAHVTLSSRDQLAFVDFNNDGLTDLVVRDDATESIELIQARPGGGFLPPAQLATAEGAGGFAVGDFDNDGVPDLAISDAINGGLRIISLGER